MALKPQAVKRAARRDGKDVLLPNDDTLTPAEVGWGYKAMMSIEAGFRRMPTTGVRLRPVYQGTAHRLVRPIKLCVLAVLLQRAIESSTGDTWRNVRCSLDAVKAVKYQGQGTTIVQPTRRTSQARTDLKKLGIAPPKRLLSLDK